MPKTIAKTVSLLKLFISHPGGLTVADMSDLLHVNKATVRRIADELVKHNLLEKPYKRSVYNLGMLFLDFSKVLKANNSVVEIAMPYLNQLTRELKETSSLALWDGTTAIIYQAIYPSHALKATINEGVIQGLHFTSLGKAILAELPAAELDRYCRRGLEKMTAKTITDVAALKEHLAEVHREGVAYDNEEYEAGIKGVAAVIKSAEKHVVGAICILGASVRLSNETLKTYGALLKKDALSISHELGYKERK
jgi:IclR family transcriptional regulator, KDG regulon repressor